MTPLLAVVLFYTSSHAIRAEQLLQRENIECKLIPVPRHLSSDCGVCAQINRADREAVRRLLAESRVEIQEIHEI